MIRSATWVGSTAILLWATLGALTVATGRIPPFELTALTFAIGGSAGLAWLAARGRLSALRQPLRVHALGVGGLFGYHSLYFAALRLAPPAEAGLCNYLWPLLIVLFSGFLPGGRLRARHIAGALVGFCALLVLAFLDGRAPGPASLVPGSAILGYALAVMAAMVWAGYSVLSRRFAETSSEAVAGFCLGTAVLAAVAHLTFEPTEAPANTSALLAILGLGLGPVGLAFFVWDRGVKHGDIRLLAILSYATPILSTGLLVLAGYARPTPALGLACALIVAAAVIATRDPRAARPKEAAK